MFFSKVVIQVKQELPIFLVSTNRIILQNKFNLQLKPDLKVHLTQTIKELGPQLRLLLTIALKNKVIENWEELKFTGT